MIPTPNYVSQFDDTGWQVTFDTLGHPGVIVDGPRLVMWIDRFGSIGNIGFRWNDRCPLFIAKGV